MRAYKEACTQNTELAQARGGIAFQLAKAGKSKGTVRLRVVIIRPQNSLPRENCWNYQYVAHLKSH